MIARLPEGNMTEEVKRMMKWVVAVALLGILFVLLYSTLGGGFVEQLLA